MIKPYFERGVTKPVMATDCTIKSDNDQQQDTYYIEVQCKIRLNKSEYVADLEDKLNHVPPDKRIQLYFTISYY